MKETSQNILLPDHRSGGDIETELDQYLGPSLHIWDCQLQPRDIDLLLPRVLEEVSLAG